MTVTTPLGRVLRDDDGMRLEFVRTYDDPVDDVRSALTDPDRVARWFGTLSGDPGTGTVDLVMTEDEGSTPQPVRILECAPPTRLVVELPSPDGIWRISVALRSQDAVTTLVFTQRAALRPEQRRPRLALLPRPDRRRLSQASRCPGPGHGTTTTRR